MSTSSESSGQKNTLKNTFFRTIMASLLLIDDESDRGEVLACINLLKQQIDKFNKSEKKESDKKMFFGGSLKKDTISGVQIITSATSAKLEAFVNDFRYLSTSDATEEDYDARYQAITSIITKISTFTDIISIPTIESIKYEEPSV
jgi:hypothetical protein